MGFLSKIRDFAKSVAETALMYTPNGGALITAETQRQNAIITATVQQQNAIINAT